MKQNLTAFIIFTLIISISLLTLNHTRSVCNKISHNQKLCEESVIKDDWNTANDYAKNTKSLWDKCRPRLAVMLAHSDLNEINDLIVRVTSLAVLNEKNAFITENKRLVALVDSLSKKDILTFENLF